MAAEVPIFHPSKHVPFGGTTGSGQFIIIGENLSSAAFVMTLRSQPGDTGTPIIQLTNAAAGTQGISATWDANYIHPDTSAIVGATLILPQIDEATLEALSWGPVTKDPLVLNYDLLATPSGLMQRVVAWGTFTIAPGVGD